MTYFVESTLVLILQISLPVLAVATAVGLLISIIQALTQIQEQTLPQVAKIIVVAVMVSMGNAAVAAAFGTYMDEIFAAMTKF